MSDDRPPDLDANGKPIADVARPPDLDANGKPIAAAAPPQPSSPWAHPIAGAWEGVKAGLNNFNPFAVRPTREQENAATMDALKQPRQPFGGPADIGRSIYKGVTSITPKMLGEGATDLAATVGGAKLADAAEPFMTRTNIGAAMQGAGELVDLRKPFKALSVIGKKLETSGTAARDAAVSRDRYLPSKSGYNAADQGAPQGEMPQPTPPVDVDRYMPNRSGTPDAGIPQGDLEPVPPPPPEPDDVFEPVAHRSPYPPKPSAPPRPSVRPQPDDAGPSGMQAAREKYGSVRDAAAALKTDPKALADATEGPRGVLKDPKAIARIQAAVDKIPPGKRAAEAATTNNPKFRDALLASLAAAGVKPDE